jgi:hypothetical protein
MTDNPCKGMREPMDDSVPPAWIKPCEQCARRAEVVPQTSRWYYATPTLMILSGRWYCVERVMR